MMKINFNKIIKKLIDFYPFIIFSIIIIYATRKFLFKDGNILYGEFFGSTNYFFFLKEFLNAWGNYTVFGNSNIGLTTSYGLNPVFWIVPGSYNIPFLLILSFLQIIFSTFSMKVFILLALMLPFFGMYYFAQYWFNKFRPSAFILNSISFISALIYSISTPMGNRISAGHLKYNLAHGLLPLLFLFIFKANEVNTSKKTIKLSILLSGLIIGILVWLMPHLISFYLFVLGFYFVLFILGNKKRVLIFFITNIVSALIGLLLNVNVWLPALFFNEKLAYISDPQYLSSYVYSTSSGMNIKNLITLAGGFEQNFFSVNAFEKFIQLKFILFYLAILALIGLIINNKKRDSLFLLLVGITGVVFSLGINYPFEKIYNFLFENFFLFKPFREIGKFIILYLFSLSILVPYIFLKLSNFLNKKIIFLLITVFTVYLLYVNPNFTSGNFYTIASFKIPEKYSKLNNFLSKQLDDFRIAIYPNDKYVGQYDWFPKIVNTPPFSNIFLSLFPLSKNLAISNRTMTDWSSRYLDYLELHLDQPWAVERLGEEMVKYIIVDHSYPGYEKTISNLQNNSAVKKVNGIRGFSIYEIKKFYPQSVKKKEAVYYYGDLIGIKYVPSSIALINLFENSTKLLVSNYSNYIVLYNSPIEEIFYQSLEQYKLSFFPEVRFAKDLAKEFYVPGEYLRSITQNGITPYNPEIIRTGNQNVKIQKKFLLEKGKYKVLLSTISAEGQSGSIKIVVNDIIKEKSNFRKKNTGLEWIDFGEIDIKKPDVNIGIENLDKGSLYVDYLLIIPVDQYEKLRKDFYSKIKSKKIINLKESESLNVDSLKQNQKTIYVFSQSFSPYWKICDSPVFRVNFFGTGVACKKTNLNPQFKPELLYRISLILSLMFHLILVSFIIKLAKKHD